eukprot:CAMPEP_0197027224 /NCGR_PEP_ID=MMETSP1384-20130603/7171_1 /TAXON_ID=29189 /ORGANISM="Ammonia sp." /LENGTH=507 /DNA_ID=CAMNT_0042456037 /DNA_START=965 /DNA_END=2488 /DNA_ORIENTATION=-
MSQRPESIEMKPMGLGSCKDSHDTNNLHQPQHSIIEKQVIVNYKHQIRFVVGYLQRLASLSICLSSIVLGIVVGAMCMQSTQLSAIRTLAQQLTNYGVHKHLKSKLIELMSVHTDFMDEWHILFLVSCTASIVLAICAIFCLDLKRINRIICYSVVNIILLLVEIILTVTAFLECSKFQTHNQGIITAFYQYNHTAAHTQLFTEVAGKIMYSSQIQMMLIICLFIACSILKFVSIPITFSLIISPNSNQNRNGRSSRKSSPSISDIILNVLSINPAHYQSITAATNRLSRANNASLRRSHIKREVDMENEEEEKEMEMERMNARAPRLSEIHFPRPPPRAHADVVQLERIASQRVNDEHHNEAEEIPIADIVSLAEPQGKHSFTSSMMEGHGPTKRRNTVSDFSVQRYPSLPSETANHRSSDSEMLYGHNPHKQRSEGAFCVTAVQTPCGDKSEEEEEEQREEVEEEKEECSPLKCKTLNKVKSIALLLEKQSAAKRNIAASQQDTR